MFASSFTMQHINQQHIHSYIYIYIYIYIYVHTYIYIYAVVVSSHDTCVYVLKNCIHISDTFTRFPENLVGGLGGRLKAFERFRGAFSA